MQHRVNGFCAAYPGDSEVLGVAPRPLFSESPAAPVSCNSDGGVENSPEHDSGSSGVFDKLSCMPFEGEGAFDLKKREDPFEDRRLKKGREDPFEDPFEDRRLKGSLTAPRIVEDISRSTSCGPRVRAGISCSSMPATLSCIPGSSESRRIS